MELNRKAVEHDVLKLMWYEKIATEIRQKYESLSIEDLEKEIGDRISLLQGSNRGERKVIGQSKKKPTKKKR